MDTELKELLRLLTRKSWLIALMAVVFVGAVLLYRDKFAMPEYEAVAKLIVHASSGSESIETYKEIMLTPAILAPAASRYSELGMTAEELSTHVTVSTSDKSQVMRLSARAASPDEAAAIVRAVATTFQEEIPVIMKVDSVTMLSDSSSSNPPQDVSKSLSSMLAIGLVLSLIFSVGLILLREYFDDKIRTETDIGLMLGRPVLGTVVRIRSVDLRFADKKTGNAEATAGTAAVESSKKIKAGETINVSVNQQA